MNIKQKRQHLQVVRGLSDVHMEFIGRLHRVHAGKQGVKLVCRRIAALLMKLCCSPGSANSDTLHRQRRPVGGRQPHKGAAHSFISFWGVILKPVCFRQLDTDKIDLKTSTKHSKKEKNNNETAA